MLFFRLDAAWNSETAARVIRLRFSPGIDGGIERVDVTNPMDKQSRRIFS